jgi:TPR repeat protein
VPFEFLRWVFHQGWLTRFRKVHDWLMKGFANHADRGNQDAQELFGFLLLHKGQTPSDKSQGARYLMMCVSEQRPKVAWQLHKLFTQGDIPGFAVDAAKAQKYFDLAQKGGHPLALEA